MVFSWKTDRKEVHLLKTGNFFGVSRARLYALKVKGATKVMVREGEARVRRF